MDQQQDTRDRDAIRVDTLTALLLSDVTETTFADLRKGFEFSEIQALRNPEMALPDSLPVLTDADRKAIASVLAAGPPKPESRKGGGGRGQDGLSRFEPDPRYDGRALQLACAITERVDAKDPVHRRDLVLDIRALLKSADAAQNLPENEVARVAKVLTTARVTLDAKLALAARLDDEKFNKPLFLRNVGARNPDPRRMHPLGYASRVAKETYDRDVDSRVQRALSDNAVPTEAEMSVARIVNLPKLPERSAGLLAALTYIFSEGSLQPVDDLLKEREALLVEIADTKTRPDNSDLFLERVFRTFTHREVFALAQPGKRLPGTIPALDEARHMAIAQGLTKVTASINARIGKYPWKAAAESLEDGLHPERARSRALSRGAGMSM